MIQSIADPLPEDSDIELRGTGCEQYISVYSSYDARRHCVDRIDTVQGNDPACGRIRTVPIISMGKGEKRRRAYLIEDSKDDRRENGKDDIVERESP